MSRSCNVLPGARDYKGRPKVVLQSDYTPSRARRGASRPGYDREDKSRTVKHRRKLCQVSSGHWLNVRLPWRTDDSPSVPSRYIRRLSRWKMIIIVSRWCTFAAWYVFSRSRQSRGNTKLSGHVSHLIIPACRRGACAALVLKNITRRRSKERSPRSFYLDDKSKFPVSPLYQVSRLGSRCSFLATATCDTFAVLNFN